MNNQEYIQIREDLAAIKTSITNLTEVVSNMKSDSFKLHSDHENRINKLELEWARHEENFNKLSSYVSIVLDNQKAVTNLRKFFWAIGTTASGALVLAILNMFKLK